MAKTFEGANNKQVLDTLLNSNQTLNAMGIGTAAIVAGFVGTVEDIRFDEVAGLGIQKRQDDQEIRIVGIPEPVKLAAKGEYPTSLFLIFEGGARKLAIPALFQSPKSSITLADGTEKSCTKMVGTDWKALIGKTLECTNASSDEANMLPRPSRKAGAVQGETEMRPSRVYNFTVVEPQP